MGTFGKAVFMCFIVFQVKGNSCPYDNELSAISIPSITTFNKSLDEPYDRIFERRIDGLECTWTIEISRDGHIVHLNFPTFHMLNDTSTQNGDCVAIYDGDDDDIDSGHLIQELCNRMPKAGYNSTGRYLSVVFRQGDRSGWRWMTMNYTLATSPDVTVMEEALQQFVDAIKEVAIFIVIGVVGCGLCSAFMKYLRQRRNSDTGLGSIRHRIQSFTRQLRTSETQSDPNEPEVRPSGRSRRASLTSPSFSLMSPGNERLCSDAASQEVPLARFGGREADLENTDYPLESETYLTPPAPESAPSSLPPASSLPPGPNDGHGNPLEPPPSYDSLFK